MECKWDFEAHTHTNRHNAKRLRESHSSSTCAIAKKRQLFLTFFFFFCLPCMPTRVFCVLVYGDDLNGTKGK